MASRRSLEELRDSIATLRRRFHEQAVHRLRLGLALLRRDLPLRAVGRLPGDPSTPLRAALGKAQRRWAWSRELIYFLEGKNAATYLSDRKSLGAVETRAVNHTLSDDGLLLRTGVPGTVEGVPVIPGLKIGDELSQELVEEGFRGRTWRELFLIQAHTAVPGQHRNPKEMMENLRDVLDEELLEKFHATPVIRRL